MLALVVAVADELLVVAPEARRRATAANVSSKLQGTLFYLIWKLKPFDKLTTHFGYSVFYVNINSYSLLLYIIKVWANATWRLRCRSCWLDWARKRRSPFCSLTVPSPSPKQNSKKFDQTIQRHFLCNYFQTIKDQLRNFISFWGFFCPFARNKSYILKLNVSLTDPNERWCLHWHRTYNSIWLTRFTLSTLSCWALAVRFSARDR